MIGNKDTGKDPKSEAYQGIMDSFVESTKPPELSKAGEEAYSRIRGLQDARYEIAQMTGDIRNEKIPEEVKKTISSREKEITAYVAALPEEERNLITEKLNEDPKAYYSAFAVMKGVSEGERLPCGYGNIRDRIERRIGIIDVLYNRLEASIDYRIAGPGSETYDRAKKLWERVSKEERWQELPEEEKRYLEEYFGEEKEEGVRKDVERKANEESK